MSADLSKVDMLTRREIEARIAGPLIKAFMEEFGEERALEVAGKVIQSLASESGGQLASMIGGNTLKHFREAAEKFSEGGAHDTEIVKEGEKEFLMNITRCKYVDMYEEAGLSELGVLLSCNRDFAMAEGFNPKMKLTRAKTIMEGDDLCDFCFRIEE